MNRTSPNQAGARGRLYAFAFVALGAAGASGFVYLNDWLAGQDDSPGPHTPPRQTSHEAFGPSVAGGSERSVRAMAPEPSNADTDETGVPTEAEAPPDVDALVAGPDGKAWAGFLIELRDPGFLYDERERCEAVTKHTLGEGESCEFGVVHDITQGDGGRGRVASTRLADPLPLGSMCEALARCVVEDRVGLTGALDPVIETPTTVADLVRLKPPHAGLSDPEMLAEWIALFQEDLARAEETGLGEDPPTYLRMLVQGRGIVWMQSLQERIHQ